MDERARQRELLFHPARQTLGQALAKLHETRELEQTLSTRHEIVDPVQSREELDVLVDGEIAVQTELLRDVANRGRGRAVRPERIGAEQPHLAAVRSDQTADETQQRRLSRPVRPDHAEHLARPDVERDVVKRDRRPERLANAFERNAPRDS